MSERKGGVNRRIETRLAEWHSGPRTRRLVLRDDESRRLRADCPTDPLCVRGDRIRVFAWSGRRGGRGIVFKIVFVNVCASAFLFFFFFRVVVRKLWCVYRLINMSLDSEIFFILVRLDYLEEWEKR